MHEEVGLQTAATYPVVVKDAAWEAISAAFNESLTEARVQAILVKLNPGKAIDDKTRALMESLSMGERRAIANQYAAKNILSSLSPLNSEEIGVFVTEVHNIVASGAEEPLPILVSKSAKQTLM